MQSIQFKESSDVRKEVDSKKTDAYTPDDVPVPAKSRSQMDIPEENNEDDAGEENAEDDEVGDAEEDEADDGDISQEDEELQKAETGQGDASSSLRARNPLKE